MSITWQASWVMTVWTSVTTWRLLPSPMQWANMQPDPGCLLILLIDSKQESHMNLTPWIWCAFNLLIRWGWTVTSSSAVVGSKSNTRRFVTPLEVLTNNSWYNFSLSANRCFRSCSSLAAPWVSSYNSDWNVRGAIDLILSDSEYLKVNFIQNGIDVASIHWSLPLVHYEDVVGIFVRWGKSADALKTFRRGGDVLVITVYVLNNGNFQLPTLVVVNTDWIVRFVVRIWFRVGLNASSLSLFVPSLSLLKKKVKLWNGIDVLDEYLRRQKVTVFWQLAAVIGG